MGRRFQVESYLAGGFCVGGNGMHIELTTTCKTCGREWQPDHQDFVRNTWRVCASCRDRRNRTLEEMPMPSMEIDHAVDLDNIPYLYDAHGHRCPVIRRSRRTMTIDRFGARHDLCRRELARDGVTQAGDTRFFLYRSAIEAA